MKHFSILILGILFSTFLMSQNEMIYTAKSGKIVYQYELDDTKSTYTLIFDNNGKKQVIDITSTDGERVKTIITPELMFIVNYEDKQVMKIPTNMEDSGIEGSSGGLNLSKLVHEVSGQSQFKTGKAEVAGKTCDVYNYNDGSGNKGKYWIWNGFLLKADFIGEDGDHAFMQVKEIKLDVPISNSEFTYPTNFEMNDMSKMMEQMQQLQEIYGVPDGN